jgi:hypothetical protein
MGPSDWRKVNNLKLLRVRLRDINEQIKDVSRWDGIHMFNSPAVEGMSEEAIDEVTLEVKQRLLFDLLNQKWWFLYKLMRDGNLPEDFLGP